MRRPLVALALAAALAGLVPARAALVNVGGVNPVCPTTVGTPYECENLSILVNTQFPARLDATFYYPKDSGPSNPVPAVLMTHGYGGWHRSNDDIANAAMLASAGYAVLAYTSRGFGRSEGQVMLESPEGEVRDARDLITWLGTPSLTGDRIIIDDLAKHDPRAGMFGGSYAGGIQLLTAAWDPDHRLDAITPQITWNDLRYSLATNGVTKHGWIDLLYASGKYSGYFGPIGGAPPVVSSDGVPADQDVQVLTSYLTNENFDNPAKYSDGTTNSYAYLERRSVAGVIANITTPTFLIQGQQDTLFGMNEALRSLNGISTPPADKKLLMFSSGHGYEYLTGERASINQKILTWFAKYLKGQAVSTGPAIEAWEPWVAGANFAAHTLPASLTSATLSATSATLANLVAPTSHSETTNFQPRTSSPSFDAAPGVTSQDFSVTVPADTVLFGVPQVGFDISSAAPEAILFAKLWDVGPAGRKLIHHLVTPVRLRGSVGNFCGNYYLPDPALSPSVPVSLTGVCLDLAGITWKVEAGHSLVLTLGTSDSMFFGSRYPGVYSISNVSLKLPM